MTGRPPSSPNERRLLGTERTLADRSRVYRIEEGLEVDLVDSYNIRRRRVFFDEVQLVTLHSRRGSLWPVVLLTLLAAGALLSARALQNEGPAGTILFVAAFGIGVLAIAAAVFPVWVVTVFGKRTRARMQFNRQRKAQSVYAEMCGAAASAQETVRQLSAELSPSGPPPGMPPPLPEPPSLP
jgi:hypothetical protein